MRTDDRSSISSGRGALAGLPASTSLAQTQAAAKVETKGVDPSSASNANEARALIGSGEGPASDPAPQNRASFLQRMVSFVGRHKAATAGVMLGAEIVANLFGIAPIQVTTQPDPRAVVIDARIWPGHGVTLYRHLTPDTAPSVLLPATVRPAANPNAPYAYRDAIKNYIDDEHAAIAANGLVRRPENETIARFHDGNARGLVVFFHGLDDGPIQGTEIINAAYDLGYDVLAPNLPGHGLRTPDGKDDIRFIPGTKNHEDWQHFEDRIFDLAKGSGNVHVVGLSAGGLVTLQLSERHAGQLGRDGTPIIKEAIAISPLLNLAGDFKLGGKPVSLSSFHFTNEQAAEFLGTTEAIFGGPVDQYLKTKTVDMKGPNPPTAYGTRYIDQDVVLGLVINADATKLHGDRLAALPGGVKLVISMADEVVDPKTNLAFASKIGADTYVFGADQHVPHAMIYSPENPNRASVEKVRDVVVDRLRR